MKFSVAFFGNEPLPILLDYAELAESLGFEGVWFTDTQLVCREVYVHARRLRRSYQARESRHRGDHAAHASREHHRERFCFS